MEALALIAGLIRQCLHQEQLLAELGEERRKDLRAFLDGERRHVVVQPIVDLRDGGAVGYEALTRFADAGLRRPQPPAELFDAEGQPDPPLTGRVQSLPSGA